MKNQAGHLDGTPAKRIFWSIIADYDTATALCELVDNAIDEGLTSTRLSPLHIALSLDVDRQTIEVVDNAGGVPEISLNNLITPGGSDNDPDGTTIGVFGVGSKRAVMALAEHTTIRTRHDTNATFQIDIDESWAASDSWDIPYYEIDSIDEGCTMVALNTLRRVIPADLPTRLRKEFSYTYGHYLRDGRLSLTLNDEPVESATLDQWAFPETHEPRRAAWRVVIPGEGVVNAVVTAGLIRERDPSAEDYGVSFYCNDRLIIKNQKTREVGYYQGSMAGVPHPDASLARVLVELTGPAKLMPWTSNKAGINYSHPVFRQVQPTLLGLLGHFSSLSRRTKDRWSTAVFPYPTGEIVGVDPVENPTSLRTHLPSLPRVQQTKSDRLVSQNHRAIENQPWTLGLVEAVAATDLISRQRFHNKNRIALLLLDSTFEIALKEFIVHDTTRFPRKDFGDEQLRLLFANRTRVIETIRKKVHIPDPLLERANHYYGIRNKLVHERATGEVVENDIRNYRQVVQQILQILFGINIGKT